MALDALIAEQLTMLCLTGAQESQRLTGAMDRNLVANAGSVLTLGVQQINAAALNKQVSVDPMEAASAASIRSSQDPSHFAGLQSGGVVPQGTAAG